MAELGVVVVDIFLRVRQVPGRHARFDRIGSVNLGLPQSETRTDCRFGSGFPRRNRRRGFSRESDGK
ncbi:hypothetical protein PanWU01x14_063780 [Parasponia andersonii]|uniref:Uncharacterized protein n=1 Tax=Parasponia andersonii TaxID=3476 RepID=A0A2P5DH25_PARAD|nr:hypothetical protein PanWU01x14_063780 [Parasponia andersonii]